MWYNVLCIVIFRCPTDTVLTLIIRPTVRHLYLIPPKRAALIRVVPLCGRKEGNHVKVFKNKTDHKEDLPIVSS